MRRKKRYKSMAQDLEEFYDGKNLYDLALQFQKSFLHDYNPSKEICDRRRLDGKDRVSRGKWMAEEIMEYVSAGDSQQIDQIDALVDLLYFVLGTFVMIGFDPFLEYEDVADMAEYGRKTANNLHEEYGDWHPPAADRLYMGSPMEWRARSGKYAIDLVFDFMLDSGIGHDSQVDSLMKIMYWTLKEAAIVGADLEPYFLIVHTSNMTKLWADGKPRFANDGKVRKPETWQPPRKEMEAHMLMELQQEEDSAEIPF